MVSLKLIDRIIRPEIYNRPTVSKVTPTPTPSSGLSKKTVAVNYENGRVFKDEDTLFRKMRDDKLRTQKI